MFGKILGKKKDDKNESSKELLEVSKKIESMNLTEMRTYVNNKISSFEISTLGLLAVMNKLTVADSTTKKFYILEDDMDSKKKKAFDLVLMIAQNKKLDLNVLNIIQEFSHVYENIITQFDTDNKEIYTSRFKDMVNQAIAAFSALASEQNKMKILG